MDDELPEIMGGSLEVTQVRETFDRLFMMVRLATSTFYAGDLDTSYTRFVEALSLFTKLGNEKAMGIANNDLGVIMLAVYRTLRKTGHATLLGYTKEQVVEEGCAYFKDAIDAGERALAKINEDEGWSTNYLIFMQQLSNRYFNRAMFLLTVRDDHPQPAEAERQGRMDLATSKDMDREVVDNGDREGFKGDPNEHFELLISRIRGGLSLMRMGYDDKDNEASYMFSDEDDDDKDGALLKNNSWGLQDLLGDARVNLMKALSQDASRRRSRRHPLFQGMGPAGQMQRLDMAFMEYYCLVQQQQHPTQAQEPRLPGMGSPLSPSSSLSSLAARIAIRMLVEDEYVIGEAGSLALSVLISHVSQTMTLEELSGNNPLDVLGYLNDSYKKVSQAVASQFLSSDHEASYYACNSGDVTMEFF